METTYLTSEGDVLDWICWKYYFQQLNLSAAAFANNSSELDPETTLKASTIISGYQSNEEFSSVVEMVWKANPSLVDKDLLLPSGISIVLPDIQNDVIEDNSIKLWD